MGISAAASIAAPSKRRRGGSAFPCNNFRFMELSEKGEKYDVLAPERRK
jgi:hypothetical protein